MPITIKESDIKEEVYVCPYCMEDAGDKIGCCGESSCHFEHAIVTKDDECFLLSEIVIKEE
jgi:hypothetical protein